MHTCACVYVHLYTFFLHTHIHPWYALIYYTHACSSHHDMSLSLLLSRSHSFMHAMARSITHPINRLINQSQQMIDQPTNQSTRTRQLHNDSLAHSLTQSIDQSSNDRHLADRTLEFSSRETTASPEATAAGAAARHAAEKAAEHVLELLSGSEGTPRCFGVQAMDKNCWPDWRQIETVSLRLEGA